MRTFIYLKFNSHALKSIDTDMALNSATRLYTELYWDDFIVHKSVKYFEVLLLIIHISLQQYIDGWEIRRDDAILDVCFIIVF
jgi:hypothetical protein